MLTQTPGPQVALYKAHSGIKWWSSEKLEPRIPPRVNVPIVVWGCQRAIQAFEMSNGSPRETVVAVQNVVVQETHAGRKVDV